MSSILKEYQYCERYHCWHWELGRHFRIIRNFRFMEMVLKLILGFPLLVACGNILTVRFAKNYVRPILPKCI